MDSRVESDRSLVLPADEDSTEPCSMSKCDIDTSSTSVPRPQSSTESWNNGSNGSGVRLSNVAAPVSVRVSGINSSGGSSGEHDHIVFTGVDQEAILQAVVFIEDGYNYRSIDHKVTSEELHVYRIYRSNLVNRIRILVVFLLHMLAFVEYPSSLAWTSDPRYRAERVDVPCWLTQSTELVCLLLLLLDNLVKMHLMGLQYFKKHKWDIVSLVIIVFSFVDWSVSFGMGCQEFIRFRRILRPYFLIQNNSLMKKIVRCLKMTLPEVISVLLLLFFHLYIFTLLGMLMFPLAVKSSNSTDSVVEKYDNEGSEYFGSLLDSFISLLVLLTTANNPDVTIPAYSQNRLAAIFFILYLVIGLYFFMNVLLAVIYNQFRGYFLSSMQSSLMRRRLAVRAAFEVLHYKIPRVQNYLVEMEVGIGPSLIKSIITMCRMPQYIKTILLAELDQNSSDVISASEFEKLFMTMDKDVVHKQKVAVRWFASPNIRKLQRIILHQYFTYFGIAVAATNLLVISVGLGIGRDKSLLAKHSLLRVLNFLFVLYYLLEQLVKCWANGWRRFISAPSNVFDSAVTLALVVMEIISTALDNSPFSPVSSVDNTHKHKVLWNIIRIINILIMVRMFKMVPYIRSMNLVASVLLDLIKNMRAFLGISVVCFYAFAILGMELFHGVFEYSPDMVNRTYECGSYEQLHYWANNFDDFFASVVVLWDVMVVNNWQVFLYVFKRKTTPWSYMYFIAWWLISVIVVLNLFTALIMENFIMKWDRRDQTSNTSYESVSVPVHLNTVHSMFKDLLQEPQEAELLAALRKHHFLKIRGMSEEEVEEEYVHC